MATSWKHRRTLAWRGRVVGTTLVTAFAAGGVPVAFAQSADAAKLLIEQGNYWQSNRRGDLAAQAWQKLLQLNPNQADGLYGMGLVEADRGHAGLAQGYLDKLRKVAPGSALIDTLASRLGQGAPPAPPSPQETQLREARQLAQAGQPVQATQHYRAALDGQTAVATPQVTLEYLQTLGGTAEGWDDARRGLEKLAHDHPDDARVSLALAQHLTYREATRREGIRQLAPLSTRADVGAAAKASWRQALIWLGARASDAPAYQAYLQDDPDDAAVKARFDAIVQTQQAQEQTARANRAAAAGNAAADARGRAVAAGFDALQKGDLDTATARFTGVLADHPNDADALGGMGVLRLKQEKFADAQQLLERAARGPNPGR
ncbi:MAG: tetratricopeptide repeat protein [Janthinobacterium lividum]